MKTIPILTVAASFLFCAATSQAALDFSSSPGSAIQFGPGSQFSITDSATADGALGNPYGDGFAQFHITSSGSAMGLNGSFGGGPWTFGAITPIGPMQTANVTTTGGTFAIDDGAGFLLTGNVSWVQVYTLGATGGLNAGATINVTGLSYSGLNADLAALVASPDGTMQLAFQFATAETLTQLANGATIGTSYNGTLIPAAVPEPTTIIAGVLLLLPVGMSTLRILRKHHA